MTELVKEIEKMLDKKLEEKLEKVLDEKLEEKLEKVLDKKLDEKLDEKLQGLRENLFVVEMELGKKFDVIYDAIISERDKNEARKEQIALLDRRVERNEVNIFVNEKRVFDMEKRISKLEKTGA